MHRREVDDVEAELRELAAAPSRRRGSRRTSGKELVPRADRARRRSTSTCSGLGLDLAEPVARGRGEALLDGQLVAAEERGAFGELSRESGWTPACLRRSSSCHVAIRSVQASTVNDQNPGRRP